MAPSGLSLCGRIERITYFNPDNHYTIARFKSDQGEDITVVGPLPHLSAGTPVVLTGEWATHPKYGRQFKASACEVKRPESREGIEKYLGSGLIKGIGPATAALLVKQFGEKTLDIIDKEPEKLLKAEGIGRKKLEMITTAWAAQREMRSVMVFLQTYDISPGYAVKIFKQYGAKAIALVTENPYRLSQDIPGIGFTIADRIARQLGLPADSPARAEAGILHTLTSQSDEGHLFFPYLELLEKCKELLRMEKEILLGGFTTLFERKQIVIEDLNEPDQDFQSNNKAVYLSAHYAAESGVARRLCALLAARSKMTLPDEMSAMNLVEANMGLTLDSQQLEAVRLVLTSKVMILTGGPGTGKTTLIKAFIALFSKATDKIALCAPTGRAAKRLSESSGRSASTLHRLLIWNYKTGSFQFNADNPLPAQVIIVDETSMIDNMLMYQLLRAIPDTARLILVGDIHQLPSVGPGNVLRDLLDSGKIPAIRLYRIFRQATASLIVQNAHRINQGQLPEWPLMEQDTQQDFYFIERESEEEITDTIKELASSRIPDRFQMDPMRDIQILTPMNRNLTGTQQLNKVLQEVLNPKGRAFVGAGKQFRIGDKVMQLSNNYDREVFNGDMGRIEHFDAENGAAAIRFDDRLVEYDLADLDEIALSYAVSIHKSQGSEYPAVIIPLHTAHFILLQRNLLYTAITRARKLCILVGNRKALSIAVKNDKTRRRFTRLKNRLV